MENLYSAYLLQPTTEGNQDRNQDSTLKQKQMKETYLLAYLFNCLILLYYTDQITLSTDD